LQVFRDPADILHHCRGILENPAVNALQYEAHRAGFPQRFDDERVIDVTAAVTFR
jgi:hypothetical protein